MIAVFENERGISLIETVIATSILLVVMIGLLSMAGLATVYTENHGHLEARTTEYAQDKMELLLALAYNDTVSDTVAFPAAPSGGTGLGIGGSTNPVSPVAGYVDWLAADGSLLGGGTNAPATWAYERLWQVSSPSAGMKQIAVTSLVRTPVGRAIVPRSTVVALKASQF